MYLEVTVISFWSFGKLAAPIDDENPRWAAYLFWGNSAPVEAGYETGTEELEHDQNTESGHLPESQLHVQPPVIPPMDMECDDLGLGVSWCKISCDRVCL